MRMAMLSLVCAVALSSTSALGADQRLYCGNFTGGLTANGLIMGQCMESWKTNGVVTKTNKIPYSQWPPVVDKGAGPCSVAAAASARLGAGAHKTEFCYDYAKMPAGSGTTIMPPANRTTNNNPSLAQ